MTTLYFESSEDDDYRIPWFNKDGKHQQPQTMIGLLVAEYGFPIGYEIFEGNTSETKTLIRALESFQEKFKIGKPIIAADAALISKKTLMHSSAISGDFVKGDDTNKKTNNSSSLVLPLTNSERGLSLLNQDDNENVLNSFEKNV